MDLNPLLRRAVELGASDVHLKVGLPPILRRDGALGPLEESAILTDRDVEAVLEVVGVRSPERLEAFKQSGDLDVAYQDDDLPRFRVNAFKQRGHISFAFRVIPKNVPTFEMLGLPPGVKRLAEEHRGLVLVTGATGSGKTTTLAARTPLRSCTATTAASSTSGRSAWTRWTSCRRFDAHCARTRT